MRLNGSSKSHWPTDVTSLKLSVFINVLNLDIEFCEELLLQKKINASLHKDKRKRLSVRTSITNYS